MGKIIQILGSEKIRSRARDLVGSSLFQNRIALIEDMDYKLQVHESFWNKASNREFTIILTSHGNNIHYFRESIESILNQTVENYELILVDHGCESNLKDLIYSYFLINERIKLITFKSNLYDPKAASLVNDRFSCVLNSALFCSDGEYVYFLSYDDFLSPNYIDCMQLLFVQNPKCIVATPSVASINEASQVNISRTEWFRKNNIREKYINGIDLAISVITNRNLFSAPGGLCCYRTNIVLAAGGLDAMNDLSQIFKFSVLGDVGTASQATLYWRHHDNQTNKNNKNVGAIYYSICVDWLRHIKNFYVANCIPIDYQLTFEKYYIKKLHSDCMLNIRDGIRSGWQGAIGVLIEIYRTAPLMYMFYFFLILFAQSPYMFYNSIPKKIRAFYRNAKNLILSRITGF